ncbi:MAG: MFS transporter [Bacillota bacterium]|nr:MFS transporter [Bacillota bacterium]
MLADGIHALVYPLLPVIAAELGLNYAQAGLVRAVFNTAGAAFQVPAGVAAEKLGEYLLISGGNAFLSAGLVAMSMVAAFSPFLLVTFFAGLGGNAQHPVGTGLISRVYEGRGRGQAVGTLNFSGDIGKLIAPLAAGLIASRWGWRWSLATMGIAGLGLALALWLMGRQIVAPVSAEVSSVRNSGEGSGPAGAGKTEPGASGEAVSTAGREGWGISRPWAFGALVLIGVLDSSVRGATLTLLPFLLDSRGFEIRVVSLILAVVFAGGAAGKFACGWIGDRWGTLAVIWLTEIATSVTAVAFLVTPFWAMLPLAVLFGFALNGTSSVLYAAVAGFVGPERRARAYGLYYTAAISASALSPVLYGWFGDRVGLVPAYAAGALATLLVLPLSAAVRRDLIV